MKPAFGMAVEDDLLRKNPFAFPLASVVANDSMAREALSQAQEEGLLDFIRKDEKLCRYYDAVYILLHTGMRISEFAGLTVSDIDMEGGVININHQLQKVKGRHAIVDTKTECGKRLVPMTDEVRECFQRILEKRQPSGEEPVVDGRTGFLYLDRNGMPAAANHWEKYFQSVREKYNRLHEGQPLYVTPHVCRHTFCSNMARRGMNPKTLQKLMGHSEVSVTLNVYTHVSFDDVAREMKEVCGR